VKSESSIAVIDWDVDGIASGIILKNMGIVEDIIIPPIGEYNLSDTIIDVLTNYEHIFFLDLTPSPKTLARLRSLNVTIIDHVSYCPESYKNIKSICEEDYSTTYLIMKTYGWRLSYEVFYGLLNDLGGKVKELDVFKEFKMSLNIHDEDVDRILEFINYLNIPIYFSDISLLYENIGLIENNFYSLEDIPSLSRRIEYMKRLENTLPKILSNIKIRDRYALLNYDSKLYLIRRLPLEVYKKTLLPSIILDTGYFDEYIQIASYCPKCDFRRLIKYFRKIGYAAGGGKNFIGIIVDDKVKIGEVLNKVINMLY